MDQKLGNRIINLRERIVSNFDFGNWEEIGLLTGYSDDINRHPRLLRSLHWGDEDYAGNVLTLLRRIAEKDVAALDVIEDYLNEKFQDETHYVSARPSAKKITFSPNVFQIPDSQVEQDLVSVMMPFQKEFDPVYDAIKHACEISKYRSLRADDIWEESTIIQDIFNLIYRSTIVISDFTGKNPNVMYETGIAHTLGKLVVPISQSINDVPFDMSHHRILKYLPNTEGLNDLKTKLGEKVRQIGG